MAIPDAQPTSQSVHLQEPPPAESSESSATDAAPEQAPPQTPAQPPTQSGPLTTDADRLVDQYRKIGQAEKHVYGQSAGGAPNFNINLHPRPADAAPAPPGNQSLAHLAVQRPGSPAVQSPAPPLNGANLPAPTSAAKNPAAKRP